MGQVNNIEIVSVDAYFGNQHMVQYTALAGTGLSADYFLFSSPTTNFYVWYNTGASVDPAVVGATGIEVDILVGDSAIQVASKTAAAINLTSVTNGIHAVAKTNSANFQVEAKGQGAPLSPAAAGTSTFVTTIINAGSLLDLGYLDGDVELTVDEQVFDIVPHQTGTQVIGSLRTGVVVGPINLTLKETVAAKLKVLMESSAAVEYEAGVGDVVTGIGSLAGSKQFTNTFGDAKMLILHPTKNAATNYAEDFGFWKVYPKLSGLVFSGESDRKLTIECQVFLDDQRVNEVNQMVVGLNQGGSWQSNLLKA